MSALDDILKSEAEYEITSEMHVSDWKSNVAGTELDALRAAASEADALRAERDEAERRLHLANDELVAIQTKVCAIHTGDILTKIDALARKIETALDMLQEVVDDAVLSSAHRGGELSLIETRTVEDISAWLAANSPTPAPEAEQPSEHEDVTRAHCVHCGNEMPKNEIRCFVCHP